MSRLMRLDMFPLPFNDVLPGAGAQDAQPLVSATRNFPPWLSGGLFDAAPSHFQN
jgi:hypothetical protein